MSVNRPEHTEAVEEEAVIEVHTRKREREEDETRRATLAAKILGFIQRAEHIKL